MGAGRQGRRTGCSCRPPPAAAETSLPADPAPHLHPWRPAAAASLTVTDGRVAELSLAELRAAGLDEERHPDAAALIKVPLCLALLRVLGWWRWAGPVDRGGQGRCHAAAALVKARIKAAGCSGGGARRRRTASAQDPPPRAAASALAAPALARRSPHPPRVPTRPPAAVCGAAGGGGPAVAGRQAQGRAARLRAVSSWVGWGVGGGGGGEAQGGGA